MAALPLRCREAWKLFRAIAAVEAAGVDVAEIEASPNTASPRKFLVKSLPRSSRIRCGLALFKVRMPKPASVEAGRSCLDHDAGIREAVRVLHEDPTSNALPEVKRDEVVLDKTGSCPDPHAVCLPGNC